ncbi:MAG TPA: NAD-dependent epimerase/dehydratase family protein [Vicinamibacterales bacterium]|nr:NAD-dependent epimerase/dehydratase family protein [Vicinamibacterales bacterium]
MRVLVTGGTGFLGRAIVRAVADRGHEPVVFARQATRARLPGRAIDGDVRDRASFEAAARGVDAICHSAALVSLWRRDPSEFDKINVGGLENAIAIARALKLPRLVYTSSFLALPPPDRTTPIEANDYQRTKVAAHRVAMQARDAGAPIIVLYPGVIYGPGVMSEGNLVGRLLADHRAGKLPGVIGADRVWSFAGVDDVAAAHARAIESAAPGSHYQLGGDNAPQIRAFEILREIEGTAMPRHLPYWLSDLAGAAEELRARVTGRPPLVTRGAVEIFRHDWPLEHADAARDLGLRVTPVTAGIANLLSEFRAPAKSNAAT